MIKYLENDNFDEEIKNGFMIVDFYADWCGPCKMLGEVLENLDENILKVNVDVFPSLATKYGVMSIPTMVFMKDGKEIKKEIGFRSKEEIQDILKDIKK